MNAIETLSRSEMKAIKGGRMAWMECDNCNNDSCRGWVDECSLTEAIRMCGPGYAGEGGPAHRCDLLA